MDAEQQERQRAAAAQRRRIRRNLAAAEYVEDNVATHSIGTMDAVCRFCGALHWLGERTSGAVAAPRFTMCCGTNGRIALPALQPLPRTLQRLFSDDDEECVHFRDNIRAYNSILAFTSIGANVDENLANGRHGVFTYRIQGQLCHRIGSLLPGPDAQPKFAQLYIHDTAHELENRLRVFPHLRRDTLESLQQMLHEVNPYVRVFSQAIDVVSANPATDVQLVLRSDLPNLDRRRYNAPTDGDVAVILPGDEMDNVTCRDIVLSTREGGLRRIAETQPFYDPLQYVLLFPFGENGWSFDLRSADGQRRVTLKDFSAFRLQVRENCMIPHCAGRLLHVYMVDCYARIEQERLNGQRQNQDTIRAELFQGLQDAVARNDANPAAVGRRIVLASSFTGGPRHMHQLYQDAMSVVREFGKPDLFITFTCNPKWPEIQEALLPNQKVTDRPDICARVFKLKLDQLKKDLFSDHVFGRVVGRIHVVEFQKRGLPHAHILLIVEDNAKPRTPDDYDALVCAELPDPDTEPLLHEIVSKSLMHGPCGAAFPASPCMIDGACSKRYPRRFSNVTTNDNDGYPSYRRRDNGRTVDVRRGGGAAVALDNRWVVPYNPFLTKKYNAHINVEICSSITSIKYLYKYVYKGCDRVMYQARAAVNDNEPAAGVDEITRYLDARYVSASEACWRIFNFSLHAESPNIVRLQVHLPNQEQVLFANDANVQEIVQAGPRPTTLTAWFAANGENVDDGRRRLMYHQFPKHFTWNKTAGAWRARVRGETSTIGRMFMVSPSEGERFYLRLLLHHVAGAQNYEMLRTVEGRVYDTFRDAASAMGLVEGNNEWREALAEAAVMQTGKQLRHLFAIVLLFGNPVEPEVLFDEFQQPLCDDIRRGTAAQIVNVALLDIQTTLRDAGRTLTDFPNMPLPDEQHQLPIDLLNRDLLNEMAYDVDIADLDRRVGMMNVLQREAYNRVVDAIDNVRSCLFFVDALRGTGKTFLLNVLLDYARSRDRIALAVASSGIAALLLHGGRTAHSHFRIPIAAIDHTSVCNIAVQSSLADLIRRASVIVWDEISMANKYQLACVSRTLCDIAGNEQPFGGKIVVFAGDFRQVLPVVRHGERAKIVSIVVKRWPQWSDVNVLRLEANMRVQQLIGNDAVEQAEFAEYLLRIGNGTQPTVRARNVDDYVQLSEESCVDSVDQLIDAVFDDLQRVEMWTNRAILTPKNDDVDHINSIVMERLPGDMHVYRSADSIIDDENAAVVPVEFLNTLNVSGLPPHMLELKVNSPIILLRNLHPSAGLCNGTRLLCKAFNSRVIDAEIISGSRVGDRVFIPRMCLLPSDSGLPFAFQRRQFPVKTCFAMTINKSQSQTFDFVGLYLPRPVFTHGQLYVALSRVGAANRTKVFLGEGFLLGFRGTSYTRNVVYNEVL